MTIKYEVTVYDNGRREWWVNGKRHRLDGPAVENGSYKTWYVDGKLHRLDGPAVENGDTKSWWVDGKRLTEAEFNSLPQKPCSGKVVTIDGVRYKLTEIK
jgi:antitoxin component YwqK of YwqJK toxin-antitoxin module